MKEYEYTVTIQEVGSIKAKNKTSAIRKIIKTYEDNNSDFILCEEEIDLIEIKK